MLFVSIDYVTHFLAVTRCTKIHKDVYGTTKLTCLDEHETQSCSLQQPFKMSSRMLIVLLLLSLVFSGTESKPMTLYEVGCKRVSKLYLYSMAYVL